MCSKFNLRDKCYVHEDWNNDGFVGIKLDSKNQRIYFPLGYNLSKTDEEVREDIICLINVLSEFGDNIDRLIQKDDNTSTQQVCFPINAYIGIILYYLNYGYYKERITTKKTRNNGKIHFADSIRKNVTMFQDDGSPYFGNGFTVLTSENTENAYITRINQYCVYEAFKQLGWLYTSSSPQNYHIEFERDKFLYILNSKLKSTNNSADKLLFNNMIKLIEHIDTPGSQNTLFYGTYRFEYVWEKLIDSVFGIKNKEMYFPRTQWSLKYGQKKKNYPLEPDTIMICNDKIYILDAKYYRYGVTAIPGHLPDSSSISKQITYGEYIYNQQILKEKYGDNVPVYNAFLMPYNKEANKISACGNFANIGEATCDWKNNEHPYERVQGLVVDTRYLMHNYRGANQVKINMLAETIDSSRPISFAYFT